MNHWLNVLCLLPLSPALGCLSEVNRVATFSHDAHEQRRASLSCVSQLLV